MRLPWSRREPTPGADALDEAEQRLREAVDRWSEVRKVSGELAQHRERNHFAEAIAAIMRGARP